MADHLQFEDFKPATRPECRQCEELLADAVDELLSAADQVVFDRHLLTCAACAAAFADARRGAAWLEMIKTPRPEPSAQLLERILHATGGMTTGGLATSGMATGGMAAGRLDASGFLGESILRPAPIAGVPSFEGAGSVLSPRYPVAPDLPTPLHPTRVLPFRPRASQSQPAWHNLNRLLFEPRLAMTAAMAFFSIALTMNLAGVHLDQLHARNLGPAGIRRSYYEATASVSRRCEGLRVVHTVEARLDDLRQDGPGANLSTDLGTDSAPERALPESRRGLTPDEAAPSDTVPNNVPAQQAPETSRPQTTAPDGKQSGKQREPDPRLHGGGMSVRTEPPASLPIRETLERKPVTLAATLLIPPTQKEGGLA